MGIEGFVLEGCRAKFVYLTPQTLTAGGVCGSAFDKVSAGVRVQDSGFGFRA